MIPMIASPAGPFAGSIDVPGDKSISHRALILGACCTGETRIDGLLEADDVFATLEAVRALGAYVERDGAAWRVLGRGCGGLGEPDRVLDMRNSGTGVRLLMGLVGSHPFNTMFAGDHSLSRRPMKRIADPLSLMNIAVTARSGCRLPLVVHGTDQTIPIEYRSPIASAQVKSAVLLAGLNTPGRTSVIEPIPSRDHTERLLSYLGAAVEVEPSADSGHRVSVAGHQELSGRPIVVPGDVSSAAFPLVAALIVPGSRLVIRNVGLNPLRTGLLATLREMGASIREENPRDAGGEPVADLLVEASALVGVDIPEARVPSMIDEFPILAVAAAFARGTTRMRGLAELRVKESDRLALTARGLASCGVRVDLGQDWLEVHGKGVPPPGGGSIEVQFDHRMAMSFLVMGLAAQYPVRVDDVCAIATSFPRFVELMTGIGGRLEEVAA